MGEADNTVRLVRFKEAFGQGGYEGKTTNFTVGLADTLNQTVKEMLENHKTYS